jgi:hypothetical protein
VLAAVFVNHERFAHAAPLHHREQVVRPHRLGHRHRFARDLGDRHAQRRPARFQHVDEMQDADHVVEIAAIERQPREAAARVLVHDRLS